MKPIEKPHLIITVGTPGAGKSYFAEHFAETFKAPLISYQRLQSIIGDNRATSRCIVYMLNQVLKTNQTVVYDGQTSTRTSRQVLIKKAIRSGYTPLLVWVQTDKITSFKRQSKSEQPLTKKQFDALVENFEAPQTKKKIVVISGKHAYSSQLKIILKHLAEPQK